MKKLKKGIVLAIGFVLIMSMSGCNVIRILQRLQAQNSQPTSQAYSYSYSSEGASEEEIVSGFVNETKDEGIEYIYTDSYDEQWNDTHDTMLSWYSLRSIVVDENKYPQLASILNARKIELESQIADMQSFAVSDFTSYPETWEYYYQYVIGTEVERADSKIFSFYENVYAEMGGAHGGNTIYHYNYDVQTGKKIEIGDICTDSEALCNALEDELKMVYTDVNFYDEDLSNYIMDSYFLAAKDLKFDMQFFIGYNGVTFEFGAYDLAPYSEGSQTVTLFYSDYPNLFESDYCTYLPADRACRLEIYKDNVFDIDADGVNEVISVSGLEDEEWHGYTNVTVSVDEQTDTQEMYYYYCMPFYVRSNGNNYLYIEFSGENGYQSTAVYEFEDDVLTYIGIRDGGFRDLVNPNRMFFQERMDALGTYTGIRIGYVGADGMPAFNTDEYETLTYSIIVSTVELTGDVLDSDSLESIGDGVFAAGTSFQIIATDNKTYVILKADDGRVAKFNVGMEYPQTINGMDAESCFEMLYYAG